MRFGVESIGLEIEGAGVGGWGLRDGACGLLRHGTGDHSVEYDSFIKSHLAPRN